MEESLGSLFVRIAKERPERIDPRNFRVELILQFHVNIDALCVLKLEQLLKELIEQIIGVSVLEIEATEVER